jgi:galactokinase
VRAPGRAELIGTDTDDNEGYVLTMAIHLDTWIAYSPSGSTRVRVHSMNLDQDLDYRIGEEPDGTSPDWERYVNGVSQVLRRSGFRPQGVDAVLHSTVPIGGGLSSSASLEVAAALMFQDAGGFSLDPRQTARISQQAENECVGVMCGILDQYSSVFGKGGTAMLLDCRSLTHIEVRIPSDIAMVICDTNVPRTLAGSMYGQRRQECIDGTRLLASRNPEILTLRDVNEAMFERMQGLLPQTIRRRCRFIVEENQRVIDFISALIRGDRAAMGRLCAGSFAGMRDLYEKTVPEMERMWEAMTGAPGAVAARQMGGGFGGCLIGYVDAGRVQPFTDHVLKTYREKTGVASTVTVTAPAAGAGSFHPGEG